MKILKGMIYLLAMLLVVAGAGLYDWRLAMIACGGSILIDFHTHRT